MFITYWVIILLLVGIIFYYMGENVRARLTEKRYRVALEKIRDHGSMPIVEHDDPDINKAKAYRFALEVMTLIARKALPPGPPV